MTIDELTQAVEAEFSTLTEVSTMIVTDDKGVPRIATVLATCPEGEKIATERAIHKWFQTKAPPRICYKVELTERT